MICGRACSEHRDGGEQVDEAFRDGWEGEDERSDGGVGQVGRHCKLYDGKNVAGACAEGGEAKDAIGIGDQDLRKTARLRKGESTKIREHRDLRKPIGDSLLFRLILGQAYVGELWVGEGAGWDLAAVGAAVGYGKVVANDAEVVEGDVGEVGRAGAVAHGPDARCGGLEAAVDLDVAGGRSFDSSHFETHVLRVGCASGGDEQVRALNYGFAAGLCEMQADGFARSAFDTPQRRVGDNLDAFVVKELCEAFDDVGILAVGDAGVALDDCHAGAEAADRLSKFESDESAAENQQVVWKNGEFESFDVREGLGFDQAGDGVDGGAGAGGYEDTVGTQSSRAASVEGYFNGLVRD